MNEKEISEYLINYIENDKTRSAVMLTGPWGSGKSYYIQNQLVNKLEKNDKEIVCVSLYGLKNLAELNKSIYLEIRAKKAIKKINKKLSKNQLDIDSANKSKKNSLFCEWIKKHRKEITSSAYLVGKTIIKGFAGFFNVPLEFSDKDIEKLFSSINLEGKLIVLEDLERSNIDIIEVMGYVNNLVEQDGVKVLLVANEDEIIKYVESVEDGKDGEEKSNKLTDKASAYIRVKEKTINDTIYFKPDYKKTVLDIINGYNSSKFVKAIEEKQDKEKYAPIVMTTVRIMDELDIHNMRALIKKRKKTTELFEKLKDKDISQDFFNKIFYAITAYALKISNNSNLKWENDAESPVKLGTKDYQLYKCIYNYVKLHMFIERDLLETAKAYEYNKNLQMKNEKAKRALGVIYSAFYKTDQEVSKAVKDVLQLLDEDGAIGFQEYGLLSNYLIAIRSVVDDEELINQCKTKMIENLKSHQLKDGEKIAIEYHGGIEFWTKEQHEEYAQFYQEIMNVSNRKKYEIFSRFDSIDDVDKFIETMAVRQDQLYSDHAFWKNVDSDALLSVISECTSHQIAQLRGVIIGVYRVSNIQDFLAGDKASLIYFKDGINNLINEKRVKDKVKIQQLRWFEGNLNDIIKRL